LAEDCGKLESVYVAKYNHVLSSVVEEMIGLATTLIPPTKPPKRKLPIVESFNEDLLIGNIRTMKSLTQELKQSELVTCPKCKAHVDNIERELEWLEQRVPSYERIARLRRTLRELLDEIKPGIPILPEEKKVESVEGTKKE